MLAIQLDQFAAGSQPCQLFQQQTPLPPAAKAKFANQLLVSGFLSGGAGNPHHQFTFGHR